jgi:hypothetical protein
MISLRLALFAACCIGVHAPFPAAATVAIDGDNPRQRITVTIRDTSIDAALRDIGRIYGFEIKGTLAGASEAVSTTISGNLETVLTRLLRNVNHVIVRTADNRSGIEKVIISGGGSAPQPGASRDSSDGDRSHPERTPNATQEERD